MDVRSILLIVIGVLVVLLIGYMGGFMRWLPPWTGLRYPQDFEPDLPDLKDHEKGAIFLQPS